MSRATDRRRIDALEREVPKVASLFVIEWVDRLVDLARQMANEPTGDAGLDDLARRVVENADAFEGAEEVRVPIPHPPTGEGWNCMLARGGFPLLLSKVQS